MEARVDSKESQIIQRCPECEFCPYESLLRNDQRLITVMGRPIEFYNRHPHRRAIEEGCGRDNDKPCQIKYAVMRASITDRDLLQFVMIITDFKRDLSQSEGRDVGFDVPYRVWSGIDSGGISLAQRYAEVWDLGLRERNGHGERKQALSRRTIYDIVVSRTPEDYTREIENLKLRREQYELRDRWGIPLERKVK